MMLGGGQIRERDRKKERRPVWNKQILIERDKALLEKSPKTCVYGERCLD